MASWHLRQARSAISRLCGLIRNGSGKRPVVNANECQKPFDALVMYLGMSPGGVWQSLQVATDR